MCTIQRLIDDIGGAAIMTAIGVVKIAPMGLLQRAAAVGDRAVQRRG